MPPDIMDCMKIDRADRYALIPDAVVVVPEAVVPAAVVESAPVAAITAKPKKTKAPAKPKAPAAPKKPRKPKAK